MLTDAECTRSEFSASTPAALDSSPRWSGAITTAWYRRWSLPGRSSTCTLRSDARAMYSGCSGSASGHPSPVIAIRPRLPRAAVRRIGRGQRMQHVQQHRVSIQRLANGGDGLRVVEVLPERDLRYQQVVVHQ